MCEPVTPSTPIEACLNDQQLLIAGRRFSSGSVGWYHSGKIVIDGVRCQLTVTVVVIGTKPKAPAELGGEVTMEALGLGTAPKSPRKSKGPRGEVKEGQIPLIESNGG